MSKTPTITPTPNGPYIVEGLQRLRNRTGPMETKDTMALCRCGESRRKPFCDGTHKTIGFDSGKLPGRVPDKRDTYVGKEITLHDNRGICAHAGFCTDGLPRTFKLRQEPWIDADSEPARKIVDAVRKCPSGALSYTLDGVEHRDADGEPEIAIAPNGPLVVRGGPELVDTPRGEGASTEHFTLCRCGGSKNKPFCDGTHWHKKFVDDAN